MTGLNPVAPGVHNNGTYELGRRPDHPGRGFESRRIQDGGLHRLVLRGLALRARPGLRPLRRQLPGGLPVQGDELRTEGRTGLQRLLALVRQRAGSRAVLRLGAFLRPPCPLQPALAVSGSSSPTGPTTARVAYMDSVIGDDRGQAQGPEPPRPDGHRRRRRSRRGASARRANADTASSSTTRRSGSL